MIQPSDKDFQIESAAYNAKPDMRFFKVVDPILRDHLDGLKYAMSQVKVIRDQSLKKQLGVDSLMQDEVGRIYFGFDNDTPPSDIFVEFDDIETESGRKAFGFDASNDLTPQFQAMTKAIIEAYQNNVEDAENRIWAATGFDEDKFDLLSVDLLKQGEDWFIIAENPDKSSYLYDDLTGMYVRSPARYTYMINEFQEILLGMNEGFTEVPERIYEEALEFDIRQSAIDQAMKDFKSARTNKKRAPRP
ncbi:MAG: hypothetical protein CMP22_04575 [Rickettsiales bacterium]|nr:hypothetical protein [Rickettsiales bacterium]|tara:strand:- start:191 stop:931 length:741 start_codon:yes stop_codon:yes gene_type:complete